jgi:2-methylcitrate dehydratase PrpD
MTSELPKTAVAETLAQKIAALKPGALPAATTRKCEELLIDVVGLCVTARNEDYVRSAMAGCDDDGPCTVIGHQRTLTA